jgi:hypothetical protein
MIIQNIYSDNDSCNKCSTFQIKSWLDELCENEDNPPWEMRRGCGLWPMLSLWSHFNMWRKTCLHTKGAYGQSKEPKPKILLKTFMKVM